MASTEIFLCSQRCQIHFIVASELSDEQVDCLSVTPEPFKEHLWTSDKLKSQDRGLNKNRLNGDDMCELKLCTNKTPSLLANLVSYTGFINIFT